MINPNGLKGKDLFSYLKANKSAIIDMKKSISKVADIVTFTGDTKAFKSVNKDFAYSNDESKGVLTRTIVMNTYNWLDSHDDVHMPGCFTKSIKERGNKTPHLHDHIFQLTARVGMPKSWSESPVAWGDLGVDVAGYTTCLLCESEILKELNEQIYKDYLADRIDQHSVGMQYVKIELAINDEDYEDEYKVWKSCIDQIGNKEKAIQQGYFFAVYEAKLVEGSCVLLGSNELTPTMGNKIEPLVSTQKREPERVPLNAKMLVKEYYKL